MIQVSRLLPMQYNGFLGGRGSRAPEKAKRKFGLRLAQLSVLRLHLATASCGCCFFSFSFLLSLFVGPFD